MSRIVLGEERKHGMAGFIEALKDADGHGYGWIANYYPELDKHELKDIIRELLYAIYCETRRHDEPEMEHIICEAAAEELYENYKEYMEEE